MSKFTDYEIKEMMLILADQRPRGTSNSTNKEHVEHCLHQLIRFAHLAKIGHNFRLAQFGLNLGRAQEILNSYGGVECWWRAYEKLINAKDYDGIIELTKAYLDMLNIPHPSNDFINKV